MIDHCDDCGKLLEDCPLWSQVLQSFRDLECGNYREFDSVEEYLMYLEEDI